MAPSFRIPIAWAVLACGVGGLAVYATTPRVGEPALARAAVVVEEPETGAMAPRVAADYATRRADLDVTRASLAERHRGGEDVVALAEQALSEHLGPMIEAWVGTSYGFFGVSDEPGNGAIACGFFVSTLLDHAGFDVRRIELGRQRSEHIVQTFVDEAEIERFDRVSPRRVVQRAVEDGPGIYLVGLDTHTGFLVHDARSIRFCHATSRKPEAVVCEPARQSKSLRSDYTVMGKLGEAAVVAWLEGRTLHTAGTD